MSFDTFQSIWNASEKDDVRIPDDLQKIKHSGLPLQKIRRNLATEFWFQVAAIILLGVWPLLTDLPGIYIQSFYLVYCCFIGVCIYYFARFFFLYKRLRLFTGNTKDELYTMYYDIKLHLEQYRSFSYTLLPFVILFLLILNGDKTWWEYIKLEDQLPNKVMMINCLYFLVSIALVILITEVHIRVFYGRYLKKVKQLLDDLNRV